MTTINERFKIIRKQNKYSQEAFGEVVGLSRSEVGNIEYNLTIPKDFTIQMICREFGVSEEWLRNGTGEMFVPQTEEEELARLVGEVLQEDSLPFRRKLVHLISGMSDEEINKLEQYAKFLLNMEEE